MKEKFQNEYLNRKLESSREDIIPIEAQISDYEEFGNHTYAEDKGKFEFQIGDTKISLEYSTPNFFEKFKNIFLAETFKQKTKAFINVRQIDNFVIEKGNNKLNFNEIFSSKDARIYFNIQRDKHFFNSSIDIDDEFIFLEDDPLTPNGILTLSHEFGHYKDDIRVDEKIRDFRRKDVFFLNKREYSNKLKEKAAESILEKERNAWAFALNDLRPFIKDLKFNLDEIQDKVHGKCLRSYSDYIMDKINS